MCIASYTQIDQPKPPEDPCLPVKTIHLADRPLPSRVPPSMKQHDRVPSENVCGSLAIDNSAASKQPSPEIVDRGQTVATSFKRGATGQWDWRSAIRPLPTSTMDNVAISSDTQREFVNGSRSVNAPHPTDEDTFRGQKHEGIEKKTKGRHKHKHSKHTKKTKTPFENKANKYSTMTQHLVPTEQTTQDQSLSDQSMPSPQPLPEFGISELRTTGDISHQRETTRHDTPRSGDDHSKKPKHSKHQGGHNRHHIAGDRSDDVSNVIVVEHGVEDTATTGCVTDESIQHVVFEDDHSKKHKHSKHQGGHNRHHIAGDRSDDVSNVIEDEGMYRRHGVEDTATTGCVTDESIQHVVFEDDHSKKHKHSKHHGGHNRHHIAGDRSGDAHNVAEDRGAERRHKDTKTSVRVIDGPVQHFTFAPGLSTARSCPNCLRRSGLDNRARIDSSSHVPTIHAVSLPPSRLDRQYGETYDNVASVSRQMVARANWGNTDGTIPQRKSFCVYT